MKSKEVVKWAREVAARHDGYSERERDIATAVLNAAGWWNCQAHGKSSERCQCGCATAYVEYEL